MREGNAQRSGHRGGRQHFVAVGDEEQQVGAHLTEAIGQAQHGDADGLGHADVGVGTEQAFDAGGYGEAVLLDLRGGVAEFRREVRAERD